MGSINPGVKVSGMPNYPGITQDYARTFLAQKDMSTIDSGDPQCGHAEPRVTSTGPPQLEQLTVWTLRRSSSSSLVDNVLMKLFSRRKLNEVMNRP